MKQLATLIIAFLLSSIAMAQSNSSARITSGGQSVSNGNITLSYVIGQVYAPTVSYHPSTSSALTNNNNIPEQNKPEQNKIEQLTVNTSNFTVYPNPTTEWLTVRYLSNSNSDIKIQIYDLKGRNIQVTTSEPEDGDSGIRINRVNVSHLPVGYYILNLSSANSNQQSRSFKFQKK